MRKKTTFCAGFTLIEILLTLTILGIITFFTIGITRSIQSMNRVVETKKRMREIILNIRQYYQGHGDLPGSPGLTFELPAIQGEFIEQKLRMDAWGQYYEYYYLKKQTDPDPSGKTYTIPDIAGLRVDGTIAAAAFISYGPNNLRDCEYSDNPDRTFPDRPWQKELKTAGDDILYPVVVLNEAIQIAEGELGVLQNRVNRYGNVFGGVDNDGDAGIPGGGVDEDGCVPATGTVGCPPYAGFTNDPNCGTATLDALRTYACPKPHDTVLNFIIDRYALADPGYRYDPWGRLYHWGDSTLPGGGGNRRYHKFFSWGPNQYSNGNDGDDITP